MAGLCLFFGILWLICGICTIWACRRTDEPLYARQYVLMAMFVICGIAGILGFILHNHVLAALATFIGLGAIMVWAVVTQLINNSRCKTPITAICTGNQRYTNSKGPDSYAPIFTYTFQGKQYEKQSGRGYTYRKFYKLYQIGQPYTIYIDEQRPTIISDGKGLGAALVFCLIFGLIIIFVGLVLCMAGGDIYGWN